ncbi:hypothetical protein V5799_027839 [Amblyomma americanum]|uniref:T-box domain-containing protein n=1 Tax=Amblyomma americanum TaxID=6943 RepID=A0AAQ4DEK3_AMBAM
MASSTSNCGESSSATGSGPGEYDNKKPISKVYAQLLRLCHLATSTSESDDSSSVNSSSGSTTRDSSSDSTREDDGTASETVGAVGEGAPAARSGIEGVQNAAPWQQLSKDDDVGADQKQPNVPASGTSSVALGPAVRIPHVTLVNKTEFLPQMELQISSEGRLMKPAPTIRFSNLNDELQYAVWVSFIQDSGACAGEYMHPESPRPGSAWNGKPLTFSKLKLFAANTISRTPITLLCNKRYFLQINFGNVNEHGHIMKHTVYRQAIVSTWFVAVHHNQRKFKASTSKKSSNSQPPANKRKK